MSKTHDLLSRDDWSGASLATVLENELSPFRHGQADRFRLDGSDLDLPPRYVLTLGMTVHELTANAAKHGALSVENGRSDIAWRVVAGASGARQLVMEWQETGGPPVEEPRRRGYGTHLITGGITHELGGRVRLAFEPLRPRCTIDLPLGAQDRFTSFREGMGTSWAA